jgi:hypothetical protein
MSDLNLLYYLCQRKLGLTPIEAFLYRSLKSCPLKESAIAQRLRAKGIYLSGAGEFPEANEIYNSPLKQRKSCLFGFFVHEMLQKGLLQDFVVFTPSWSPSAFIFSDIVSLHNDVRDPKTIEPIEEEDRERTTDCRLTYRYNREAGVIEAIEEESIANSPRIPGLHPGAIVINDDFDEPLPDDFWTND